MDVEIAESDRQKIIRFCVHRQNKGIHGRIQKTDDSCYTFWTGAALCILTDEKLLNLESLSEFIKSCANPICGGIAKFPGTPPDPNHSFMSLGKFACLKILTKTILAGVGVLNEQVDPLFMLKPQLVQKLKVEVQKKSWISKLSFLPRLKDARQRIRRENAHKWPVQSIRWN